MIGVIMPSTSPRAATQGPRSQQKRPGDLTGVRNQKLAEERDKAQEEEAAALAAARADERNETLNTVIDYTSGPNGPRVAEIPEPEPHPVSMTIRINYPIEDMTFGREVLRQPEFDEHGNVIRGAVLGGLNTYNFKEGQEVTVPWELGAHLKERGYVYDF